MTEQPEALRLADELNALLESDSLIGASTIDKAAAELRRLHEVNAELVEALKLIQIECDNLHHAKKHRHTYAESCKAKEWVNSVLAKAEGK